MTCFVPYNYYYGKKKEGGREEERNLTWLCGIQRKARNMAFIGRNGREGHVNSRLKLQHTFQNQQLFMKGKHANGKCEFCGDTMTLKQVIMT